MEKEVDLVSVDWGRGIGGEVGERAGLGGGGRKEVTTAGIKRE